MRWEKKKMITGVKDMHRKKIQEGKEVKENSEVKHEEK